MSGTNNSSEYIRKQRKPKPLTARKRYAPVTPIPMFTGIIESLGEVAAITPEGSNRHLQLRTPLAAELRVDQSVAHNGVCLTVTDVQADTYQVTAIDETLQKSNLGQLAPGDPVNLERCMPADGRFDGHIVQGHVDLVGMCERVEAQDGSWLYTFAFEPTNEAYLVVEKGSITVNGASLTCFNTHDQGFTVAIIPYTYEHTNFHRLQAGDTVNLEFDILGKYMQRILSRQGR